MVQGDHVLNAAQPLQDGLEVHACHPIRRFGLCRICLRELAYKGEIPGMKKASW